MAAASEPRPAFGDWQRARDAGIDIAPPPAQLRPWRPATADVDDWCEPPKLAVPGHGALVIECDPEPPEAQAFWRAAERAGMTTSLFETGAEAFEAVMERGNALALANGWRLARRRLMGGNRVEIEGPADIDLPALRRMGCIVEIVSWRTRVFVPGADTTDRVLERWPLAA